MGSLPVVFGPALATPAVRAVREDLRRPPLAFDLRLGDEAAPVPRRFFFPPAMAVNDDGDIIDEVGKSRVELIACAATEKVIKRSMNDTGGMRRGVKGLDVTSFW